MEESAYEKQREKLVEENKRRLEELFGKDDIALVPANPKKKQKRAKKEKDVDINTERRKSNRIAGNPVEHKRLKHQGDFSDDDEGIVREVGENDSDFVASDDEIAVVPATGPRRKPANIGKRQRTGKQVVVKKGGRVYDSVNGTSCHQCRQKTLDAKVQCTKFLEFKDENGNIEKIQCL
ncbi:hypothetical protein BC829DRAFT_487792 [Chytridium lagenaria]|nr:hypothetical protein BC829DRAFT_487792 [Chytridium lagenaria]